MFMPSKTSRRRAAAWLTGAAAVTGLGFAAAAPPAATAATPTPSAASADQAKPSELCFVNSNNANLRNGPGIQFPVVRRLNKGQGFVVVAPGPVWSAGHPWGEEGSVDYWIATRFLDC
ncbi:hypothetical protein [Amycolatopsis sp. GA6-003]|uniref:hypothetical protein n=1 Tax=Amycolatopsis sp. GA6-003 TaxID=2652444 RepID=UPI0039173370